MQPLLVVPRVIANVGVWADHGVCHSVDGSEVCKWHVLERAPNSCFEPDTS